LFVVTRLIGSGALPGALPDPEMRRYVEKPMGNSGAYIAKAREFSSKLRDEIFPFVESLGFDPNASEEPPPEKTLLDRLGDRRDGEVGQHSGPPLIARPPARGNV
jgi:hypothetical protein